MRTEICDSLVQLRYARQVAHIRSQDENGARPEPGEIVEVRSAAEILATLDSRGEFEGVPFMPEMIGFCGQRFRVFKRADYTCSEGEPRYIKGTVHLQGLRCDGSSHGNCQAKCLIFWKEAWIKRVAPADRSNTSAPDGLDVSASVARNAECTLLATHVPTEDGRFRCQATQLRAATCPSRLGLLEYVRNVCRDFRAQRIGWPDLRRLLTWTKEMMMWSVFVWWTRAPWSENKYQKTASRTLNLKTGDLVRVRSVREILGTLDRRGRNRGLYFTPEMFRYCGREYRVLSRVERRINPSTGRMVEFRNSCILLENVMCHGQRRFCSRSEYHYWREIWLERR